MVNCQNCVRWPRSWCKMAVVSGHSFNIGPIGKLFKSLLLWNQSADLKPAWNGWSLGSILSKLCPVTTTSIHLHPKWLPWADIVLAYIVKPYGILIVKLRCNRHADILKRVYLCQVSDTGSPEHLVLLSVGMFDRKSIISAFNANWMCWETIHLPRDSLCSWQSKRKCTGDSIKLGCSVISL